MFTAQTGNHGPFAIRYPKRCGTSVDWEEPFRELPIGQGRIIREGTDIGIISIGTAGKQVTDACLLLEKMGIHAAHYDMRFLKPIDEQLLHDICRKHQYLITVEDGAILGGLGSAVMEFVCDRRYTAQVQRLGIPDHFVAHGATAELYHECGYDAEGIVAAARKMIQNNVG
jgi:1-deoxy-D-xylulose-5-phosphate synthase